MEVKDFGYDRLESMGSSALCCVRRRITEA